MKNRILFTFLIFTITILTSCKKEVAEGTQYPTDNKTMGKMVISDNFDWLSGLKGKLTVNFDNPENISTELEYLKIIDKKGNNLYTTRIENGIAVFNINLPYDGEYYVYFPATNDSEMITKTGLMTMTLHNNKYKSGFKSVRGVSNVTSCTTCDNPIENGNMESPDILKNYKIMDESLVPGWRTTASDHRVEIWKSGFLGFTAQEGTQFMEINATMTAALYQELCLEPGSTVNWSVWHRGRGGVNVAVVKIGATVETAQYLATMEDDNDAWGHYTGSYTVPEGQTATVFVFEAVSTASGNNSVGNLIDNFEIECDYDGDGVPDDVDDDPNDPNTAFISYFPTSGKQIVAFEDLWPSLGDFDFNDAVLACNGIFKRNADNELVTSSFSVSIDAIGAGLNNGIGMMLYDENGEEISQDVIDNVNGDAFVDGDNTNGIILTNDIFESIDYRYQNNGIGNTTDSPDTLRFTVNFNAGYKGGITPELYIFRTDNRSHEVHRSIFPGTEIMDQSLFNTDDDNGNFKTETNLPWGMEILTESHFKVAVEKTEILIAYPQFEGWAASGGTQNKTWYLYPDESKVVDIFEQ
jgi:LruC domain-containing protein